MKLHIRISLTLILFFTISTITAEQLQSTKWGYTLDLPEGYELASSQNGDRYQFNHSMLPITFMIASYGQERYEDAFMALENVYKSLSLQGDMEKVRWLNEENAIGTFTLNINGEEYLGWAVSVLLTEDKGTSVFLAYAPSSQFAQCEQIIISTLDSINLVRGSILETGIITRYAYPPEGDKQITLEIAGQTIDAKIDLVDEIASEFVVQREYDILVFFSSTPLWKEAWQRFYRIIYRDSYKRLQRVAFTLYNDLYFDIKRDHPDDPDTVFAQTLLTWVQDFEYLRIPLGTDFVPLPSVVSGKGSDCDSRALLLAVLMDQMRYKTMLFISREYSHALFGIAIEGEGARLEHDGVSYLLGETTAPVSLGLVPQGMSEISNWIAIEGLQ